MIMDGWMDRWTDGWIVGAIFIPQDFASDFQNCIILGVLSEKLLSGTFLYLEDVLYLLEVPDGDHDGWDHLHSSGFCLRFPKMYNTWHVK